MKKRALRPGRLVAALLLAVHLTGCHSWRTTTISQLIAEEEPSFVRVTWTNGRQLTLLARRRAISGRWSGLLALPDVRLDPKEVPGRYSQDPGGLGLMDGS